MCDERYYPWCPAEDADWRLIAAAPDLLAALVALAEKFGNAICREDMTASERAALDAARAAIAKAGGA